MREKWLEEDPKRYSLYRSTTGVECQLRWWDCHLAPLFLPGTCYWIFPLSLISSNFVTSVKRSLIIIYVSRTIVVATSIISSTTMFLKFSRWLSFTPNLYSRLANRIAVNKYMRAVHSLFVVDQELLIASILAASVLLTFDDT